MANADRDHVRLAELVGAPSLGVDLGFGQPMEHVLRQCPIALRLAERVGPDAEAVEAVLAAAGHRVRRRREGPARLTPREVEVLRLLARGLSNKEIAQRLVISPKTASNHVEHIYGKIGASSRAAAGLFAVQHGLLPDDELVVPSPAAAVSAAKGEANASWRRRRARLGSRRNRSREIRCRDLEDKRPCRPRRGARFGGRG